MVQPCFTAYATAKAALSMMTRAMAPELAPKIRVNAIEVGGIETDALAHVLSDDSVRAQLEDNTPMQRVGLPADIAAAVVYLVSPASSFVTGKIFEVDGGVEAPAFTIPFERALTTAHDVHGAAREQRQVEVRLDAGLGLARRRGSRSRSASPAAISPISGSSPTTGGCRPWNVHDTGGVGVELDLEALLAERPRRVEVLRAHQPVDAHGHHRLAVDRALPREPLRGDRALLDHADRRVDVAASRPPSRASCASRRRASNRARRRPCRSTA